MGKETDMTVREFIAFLASHSESFAWQAGVGGMETAGGIISYLATHPEDIEPFLVGGISELPDDWVVNGCLTHHAINGKVVHPETARRSRMIKRMERGLPPSKGTAHD